MVVRWSRTRAWSLSSRSTANGENYRNCVSCQIIVILLSNRCQDCFFSLIHFPHVCRLRVLEMFGCFNIKAKAVSYLSANCINLKTLNLGQCYKVRELAGMNTCTSLYWLLLNTSCDIVIKKQNHRIFFTLFKSLLFFFKLYFFNYLILAGNNQYSWPGHNRE